MLLFIFIRICSGLLWSAFQYISCYSLSETESGLVRDIILVSIHLMLLFISWNRPHFFSIPGFQYISCYSLSMLFIPEYISVVMFQYISCYSLSKTVRIPLKTSISVSIHLMLLFINAGRQNQKASQAFQYISCYSLSGFGFGSTEGVV